MKSLARFVPTRLGQKLNVALFLFLLVVGLITATQVFFAFDRAQKDATEKSQRGLEELGRQNMLDLAQSQAGFGVLQMQAASEAAFHAAAYIVEHKRVVGSAQYDPSRLQRGEMEHLYDPDPNRRTDIVIPASVEFTPESVEDISESASLDAIFPVLMTGAPGRERDANFDATGMTYISENGVMRFFPTLGPPGTPPPQINIGPLFRRLGPEGNPERKSVWTNLYKDSAGTGLVLTAYAPIYDGDRFEGVIGVDLAVARLVDQVNTLKPTPSGFSFYIEESGEFLPGDQVHLLLRGMADPNNQALRAVIDGMRRGESAVERVNLDGREVFIGYAPMAEIGGSFGVVAPVDEITVGAASIADSIQRESDRTMIGLLAGMLTYFGIGLLAATWMGRRLILRPLIALVLGTRAVAEGNLATTLEVKGRDEMADLARSFNDMTAQMRQRRAALEAEIRERQAAQDELRALFAAMTDVVVVVDRNGNIVRIPSTNSPALIKDAEEYRGQNLREVMTETEAEQMLQAVQQALETRETVSFELPLTLLNQMAWFSVAASPMAHDEVVVVSRDITERVEARQQLERRVEDRTRELSTIIDISKEVASTLELGRLLDLIIEHLKTIVDYRRASVLTLEDDAFVLLDSQVRTGVAPQLSLRFALEEIEPVWEVLREGRPVIIDDVRGDSPYALAYQRATGPLFETALSEINCILVAPLALKDRVIGIMTVSHTEKGFYTQHHADLVMAIASHAAVAIENARLYEEAQRAARETEALLRADAELFRSLSLESVLQALVDVTVDVLRADKSILALEEGTRQRVRASRNFSDVGRATISARLASVHWDATSLGGPEPFLVNDLSTLPDDARQIWEAEGIRSYIGIPIVSSGRVIGGFLAAYIEEHEFSSSEQRVFAALAERGAVAIQNAEMYALAQQAASLEERQRLARELHDSVSQALYGIALGASTAQEALTTDPANAKEPVEYVLSLAQAGLAEMRALIFELRPESLEIEGLVAAIDKHVAATRSRYGIEVDADLAGEPDVSLGVKEVYYRIAQEALHNVVKHAGATRVDVSLSANGEGVVLEIKDNGVGFDAGQSFPGHLGLVSMAERASSVGAEFAVSSARGQGTTVRLTLPQNANGNAAD
jgi:PAS domain S-box-containing protein